MALDAKEVHWHVRRDDRLVRIAPDADGIYRTAAFPGLWLDPAALLRKDLAGVLAVLERGLATPEHAAFVARLADAAAACQRGLSPQPHPAPTGDLAMSAVEKVNLAQKLAGFRDHWKPRIVGELNGQQVKLVKFQGEFVWHHHDDEDELFLVVKGRFRMEFRDRAVWLEEGD